MIEPWRAQSACRDLPIGTFFWADGPPKNSVRQICNSCSVREQCLESQMAFEDGMYQSERAGFFGGMTPTERQRLHVARASNGD